MSSSSQDTRSAAYTDAIEDVWRTTPTDLGGWANRASQLLYEVKRLRAALQEIADTDYRGNRSPESEKAWRALNGS